MQKNKIRVGLIGIGNCCSSLVQGVEYYQYSKADKIPGIMFSNIGGYYPSDIEFVVGFDIDKRKVNKPLKEAIYAKPNCTTIFNSNVQCDCPVYNVPHLDGFPTHMNDWSEDEAFRLSDAETVDVIKILKEIKPDILINYCPVGSQKATEFYVNAALEVGIPFLNCIPVFIASDPKWEQKFIEKKLPIIGDDMRSQVGASILSAVLQQLFIERGHIIDAHIQQNSGGNTDFLNMTDQTRLKSKKISKTNVISSQSELQGYIDRPNSIHAGPSEYVRFYKDNKVAHFHIEAKGFGNSPVVLDARLSVIDSPNSAGVVIDAIRFLKVAHEMGMSGSIDGPSAYTQKTPKIQMKTSDAHYECEMLAKRELTELTKKNIR